jgi:lipopolysaccharide transport system ATP-binding protein
VTGSHLQIGICGTFDIRNYGDLLFPLIAQAELSRRLGPLDLRRFSYSSKASDSWPFDVTPLSELPPVIQSLDGMIIGGGHIIRFDKDIAPGYAPPTPEIHHPTGYWLTPALLGLSAGCPVIWNAPGLFGDIPLWAKPLMRLAIEQSAYFAVRDAFARNALSPLVSDAKIAIVPDTGFGVARLLDDGPTANCTRLCRALDLTRPYLIIQSTIGLNSVVQLLRDKQKYFDDFQLLALQIGPDLLDDDELLITDLPGIIALPNWPDPLVIAELIKGAAGVIGTSLHLAITAIAFGVPVFRPRNRFEKKYEILSPFNGVHWFETNDEIQPEWLRQRLGNGPIEAAQLDQLAALDRHWDDIASAIVKSARTVRKDCSAGALWQSLPGMLESVTEPFEKQVARFENQAALFENQAALRDKALVERDQQIAARDKVLARDRAGLAANRKHYRPLHGTKIGRAIMMLRSIGEKLRSLMPDGADVIDLTRLDEQRLAIQPYEWAFVNNLYSKRDAKLLAASFPTDNFKTVKGYDGEKGYEYEARALIQMWATEPSHFNGLTDIWRRLANSLLSPEYRSAMTRLTGRALMDAPMEAYVCHYGPGAWLGPHLDLKDKIVTHVLYFNETWDLADGGCLQILNSQDITDVAATIPPCVGNSSLLVRSDKSWHSVSKVTDGVRRSRRSLNVIFYHQGAVSTMWPPGDNTPLHSYSGAEES